MSLPKTMLGLYKTAKGPGNLELRETAVPLPGPGEVLIDVKAAGICGTDIHIKHDLFPYWPPVIMGHEFSGVIVEVGEGVSVYSVGDRVVAEPHTRACGKCELCRQGHIQLCTYKRSPGWGIDGAFASYICMPERLLHSLPAGLSFEEGALVEPAANAVQDVLEHGGLEPDDVVVIMGPGPIGLLSLLAARAGGAREVYLVGAAADEALRLPLARELGADAVVVAGKEDPVAAVDELTRGRGADLVVEASGSSRAIALTPRLVRPLGRITAIGLTGGLPVEFPWDEAMKKACRLQFNMSTGYTSWKKTIGLIASGKMPVGRLITHKAPLREWEGAFEAVEDKRAIKALLIP